MKDSWAGKISNPAQIGGIETSVLDNGPGRGTRIAWINTGTGLRYKVVLDRAMDIGDAFFNRHSLAWINHTGVVPPRPSNRGIEWLQTFGGGLLTTCGLGHVGGPETDQFGERGLHGQISNTPAEIVSINQPDPGEGKMDISITGIIKECHIFGPCLELKRTLSGTIGQPSIRIHDEVINRGNTAAPHMILYHCNFGWPLVDEGTGILWKGNWTSREGETNSRIFRHGNDFRTCPAPLDEHAGAGEEAAFIDVDADDSGCCVCGLHNAQIGIAVALRFRKAQLPWLTNWQHWGKGEYVTGLEPGTNPPVGQAMARQMHNLIHLAPGEKREYDLEIDVLDDPHKINDFTGYFTRYS